MLVEQGPGRRGQSRRRPDAGRPAGTSRRRCPGRARGDARCRASTPRNPARPGRRPAGRPRGWHPRSRRSGATRRRGPAATGSRHPGTPPPMPAPTRPAPAAGTRLRLDQRQSQRSRRRPERVVRQRATTSAGRQAPGTDQRAGAVRRHSSRAKMSGIARPSRLRSVRSPIPEHAHRTTLSASRSDGRASDSVPSHGSEVILDQSEDVLEGDEDHQEQHEEQAEVGPRDQRRIGQRPAADLLGERGRPSARRPAAGSAGSSARPG